MKNADNPRGFFNWQGNVLEYNTIGNYIVVAIIICTLVLAIIFKKNLRSYFIAKKANRILVFSNIDAFLQFIGIMMVFIWTFRIAILSSYDYPLYYEHIGLHLCRIHFILISLLLTLRKKEWLRYILFISFFSSIIGIAFGSTSDDFKDPNNIFTTNGFTYYNAGIDTHYYWDYHITHVLTGVLPIVVTIGVNKKITTIEFYRVMLTYISFAILVFTINYATDFALVRGWRSNYWYLGRDRNNEYKNFLGSLTAWPQNLPAIITVGVLMLYGGQFTLFAIDGDFKAKCKLFLVSHNKKTFRQCFFMGSSLKSQSNKSPN